MPDYTLAAPSSDITLPLSQQDQADGDEIFMSVAGGVDQDQLRVESRDELEPKELQPPRPAAP